ncbi:Uncharacterised protein [Vibrio cholerae]|nr:Uncharacterised protein [Vibrio cholerae]
MLYRTHSALFLCRHRPATLNLVLQIHRQLWLRGCRSRGDQTIRKQGDGFRHAMQLERAIGIRGKLCHAIFATTWAMENHFWPPLMTCRPVSDIRRFKLHQTLSVVASHIVHSSGLKTTSIDQIIHSLSMALPLRIKISQSPLVVLKRGIHQFSVQHHLAIG